MVTTAREQRIQRNGFYHDRVPEFTITVRAKPGASRPRIGGAHGEPPELIVAVRETAASGQAICGTPYCGTPYCDPPRASEHKR